MTMYELKRTLRHWRRAWRDDRGASMITTAVTLPLLIIILIGFWHLMLALVVKWTLHQGVHDAARRITEYGRYWDIDIQEGPGGTAGADDSVPAILPADYYELEARRIVEQRLRDLIFYPSEHLTTSLHVTVTEPVLANHPNPAPDEAGPPVEKGFTEELCKPAAHDPGDYRHHENIRFRVMATFELPPWVLWKVRIPWMDEALTLEFTDRAIGYVQCPRWVGRATQGQYDKSRFYAAEAPALPFRFRLTPTAGEAGEYIVVPTVTATITPTATATGTVEATVTMPAPTVTATSVP